MSIRPSICSVFPVCLFVAFLGLLICSCIICANVLRSFSSRRHLFYSAFDFLLRWILFALIRSFRHSVHHCRRSRLGRGADDREAETHVDVQQLALCARKVGHSRARRLLLESCGKFTAKPVRLLSDRRIDIYTHTQTHAHTRTHTHTHTHERTHRERDRERREGERFTVT